ncbi:sensor histidine kinase [Nocardioides sp.]|uniref:sensor histidine kinase n=1 Tax=Nocardioides sp. TaxID=35761 RepID=UPI00261E7117|nr:sensor histidine kinase [Nocardioides sp.]
MPRRQLLRVTAGARIFTFLAVGAPVLWYRDGQALVALGALGVLWALAVIAESRRETWQVVPVAEAGLVGLVCGLSVVDSSAIVAALIVPPFAAALLGGLRPGLLALSSELVFLVTTGLVVNGALTAEQGFTMFTWSMGALGLALIGNFVHGSSLGEVNGLTPYLDAQRLIRQLLDLSGDLDSGLDVISLAGSIASDVRDALPTSILAVYLPRGEVLVPLVSSAEDRLGDTSEAEALAVESWTRSAPLVHERRFAFPLGDGAVVAGALSPDADLADEEVERVILTVCDQVRSKAVQLDTALLFSDFRDLASADVRQRLAREMHDGIAQDIASLGYLVDALAAKPASDKQAQQLAMLRERITKIVAEVRQSVLTLRTSIGESQSLGAAISSVARHLSDSSGIPIQVSLDEKSTRLRPEVESELFRIAQESMNNAIKHAQCSSIEVVCRVHAPEAEISVSDDGRGLQQARADSHGLKIMRERARLIDGELRLDSNSTGGLTVSVRVGNTLGAFPGPTDAERVSP